MITLNNDYLKDIHSPRNQQYFETELIKLTHNESFCDCGSYNGDTLESFLNYSNGKYNKYYAFEADTDTYKDLRAKIIEQQLENIEIYNLACWNKKEKLTFQQDASSGRISNTGNIEVYANRLDNILKNKKVTFIKMDIEGAEENALKGAYNIISSQNPILAICIYHNLEDFYKIPLLIRSMNDNYKFYIRHYSEMVDHETVCYAIPKQRSL